MARPLLFLYLGAQRLQAAWASHPMADAVLLVDCAFYGVGESASAAPGDPFEALAAACSATPALAGGFATCVLLSDHWVPSASLPWDARQLRSASALAAAQDQIREAGHELLPNDIVRIDDAPFRQPRLAVAYPQALVTRLGDAVRRSGGELRSINTLAALAWRGADSPDRQASDAERVLAIVEPAEDGARPTVVLARGQSRSACLDEVITRPLPAPVAGAVRGVEPAVQALVERLGWLPAVAPSSVEEVALTVTVIQLAAENANLGLPAALAWWTAAPRRRHSLAVHTLDAVARTARPSPWRMALLCMVIASTSLLGWSVWRAETRLRHDRSGEQQVRREAPPPAPLTAEQLRRIAAINTAVTELNVPLPQLLRALEAPKDIRVALLGIEVAGRSGSATGRSGAAAAARPTLKVHVESPNSLDMTRYVALLADRKPFVQAYLARHEVPDRARDLQNVASDDAGGAYRYTVEVTWQD